MRLTQFSDFSFRILMHAAACEGRLITIEETAAIHGISRSHLMKVVNQLTRHGFLKSLRGRTGGFTLGKKPHEIRLGDVIRVTEPDFALVECFSPGNNRCIIAPRCRLKSLLGEALGAFVATLDRHTLADLLLQPEDFGISPAA